MTLSTIFEMAGNLLTESQSGFRPNHSTSTALISTVNLWLANIDAGKLNGSVFIDLKEQYPVTAHAPNFDFWTGCREIKRCEESKRTLKNPFASRLAGFNTTIKLLRITDW